MKAITYEQFGNSDVLKSTQVPDPVPASGEVLIRVAYSGVNPVDWKIRQGHLQALVPHEFPIVPGWEASGIVTAVGENTHRFKVGERVLTYCRKPLIKWGTYAELVAVDEKHVAPLPDAISMKEGASLPLTALTAWQALWHFGRIPSMANLLITAGAGGVGGLAIQFAKSLGARVYTTARLEKHGYVRSLGADEAIDYTTVSAPDTLKKLVPHGFDFVLDCAGGKTLEESMPLVKSGGAIVSIVDTPNEEEARKLGIRSSWMFVEPNGNQLYEIVTTMASGKMKMPHIEELPLDSAKKAQELSESKRVLGKLVLKVNDL